jgi:hypothetical protein
MIVDKNILSEHKINSEFTLRGDNKSYWSSTNYIQDNSKAWSVDFVHGEINSEDNTTTNYTRCFRKGK